jgi:protein-S-isoprenylcysteine O-methyltransferase Ste14
VIEFLIGVVIGLLIGTTIWIVTINKEERRLKRKYKKIK